MWEVEILHELELIGGYVYKILPSTIWFLIELIIAVIIVYVVRFNKNTSFSVLFTSLFEKTYDFFSDILGENEKYRIKSYVVTLFFVILFSNLMWVVLDFIIFPFPALHHWITIPTANVTYNISMAVTSVLIVLFVQMRTHGFLHFVYDYFPIFGKNIIAVEKWSIKNPYVYWPLKIFVKAFDIVLSLFLWFLEIIGTVAKVISLSFRLFGNMIAGAILITMLILWLSALTEWLIWLKLPVVFPLILYAQELLVAVIQAFVFPLLVAIFIKVARWEEEGAAQTAHS